jgi:hypothetical protein
MALPRFHDCINGESGTKDAQSYMHRRPELAGLGVLVEKDNVYGMG